MVPQTAPRISVVIPMLNEAEVVPRLLSRLVSVLTPLGETFEVIAVDDGSTDGTWQALENELLVYPELRVLRLARNLGQHAAILAGFESARGDWLITLDADLQNPPEEIPRLLAELRRGHDLVGTYRQGRQDPRFRKLASWLVNRLVRCFTRVEIRDFGCMLRGYSASVASAVANHGENCTFIPAIATLYATHPIEIPVSHAPRAEGKSKYSLWRLCGLALDLVTCFSVWPQRLLLVAGSAMLATGALLGAGVVAMRFGIFPRWAQDDALILLAVVLACLGAQSIAFGVLGEYIGRIFQAVRGRPRRVLRQVPPPSPHLETPVRSSRQGSD